MDIALGLPGLIKQAIDLVHDILKAKDELKNAPLKLQKLVESVEDADRLLVALATVKDSSEQNTVEPILQDLTRELVIARDKTRRYKLTVEKRYFRISVYEVAKAFFCLGAARQNKRTEEVTTAIKDQLGRLNQAVNAETYIQVRKSSKPSASRAPKPAIISKLDAQALQSVDDEEFKVCIGTQGVKFRNGLDQELDVDDPKRAAREGGYEIVHSTKVSFEITSVDGESYFYVITYDNSTGTPPELFFPRHTSADHNLSSKCKRKFPDQLKFKHDQMAMRIESTNPSTVEQQSVYFVVITKKLHEELPSRQLTMQDIQEKLENANAYYVKKFIFDIVPV